MDFNRLTQQIIDEAFDFNDVTLHDTSNQVSSLGLLLVVQENIGMLGIPDCQIHTDLQEETLTVSFDNGRFSRINFPEIKIKINNDNKMIAEISNNMPLGNYGEFWDTIIDYIDAIYIGEKVNVKTFVVTKIDTAKAIVNKIVTYNQKPAVVVVTTEHNTEYTTEKAYEICQEIYSECPTSLSVLPITGTVDNTSIKLNKFPYQVFKNREECKAYIKANNMELPNDDILKDVAKSALENMVRAQSLSHPIAPMYRMGLAFAVDYWHNGVLLVENSYGSDISEYLGQLNTLTDAHAINRSRVSMYNSIFTDVDFAYLKYFPEKLVIAFAGLF